MSFLTHYTERYIYFKISCPLCPITFPQNLKDNCRVVGMSSKSVFFILIIIVLTLFSFHAVAGAEPDALEQLIKIFEGKSLLSPQEVTKLRKILAKDQERLQKIERDIAQREKSLNEKERQLEAREAAVEKLEQSESAKRTSQTPSNATGKRPETVEDTHSGIALDVSYRDGLYFHDTKDDLFSLRIGGLLQTDYRYFSYHDENPQKNKFDLRRVRLYLAGRLYKYFSYKFEYEFQGASSREILDAYVDTQLSPFFSLRIGQFKEPFGLEHSTKDKNLVFAERSFGYYLTPSRDLGIMAHASFWKDRIYYGLGLFNGDGLDDSVGGDVDDPEWTGRLVLAPWKNRGYPFFDNLQIGGSLGYANIDRNNVNLSVRTTGLTEFFDVASSAKFNVIRNAGDRLRYGLELGWAYGPPGPLGGIYRRQVQGHRNQLGYFRF